MPAQNLIVAITAVFIVGMIWLRTRMHYARRGGAGLRLVRAGRVYFASAVAVLAIGWLAAPWIGRMLWPSTGATPTLMRVVWFLGTYYVFILVHRLLKSRGTVIFSE
jgi:hypothetical protein